METISNWVVESNGVGDVPMGWEKPELPSAITASRGPLNLGSRLCYNDDSIEPSSRKEERRGGGIP